MTISQCHRRWNDAMSHHHIRTVRRTVRSRWRNKTSLRVTNFWLFNSLWQDLIDRTSGMVGGSSKDSFPSSFPSLIDIHLQEAEVWGENEVGVGVLLLPCTFTLNFRDLSDRELFGCLGHNSVPWSPPGTRSGKSEPCRSPGAVKTLQDVQLHRWQCKSVSYIISNNWNKKYYELQSVILGFQTSGSVPGRISTYRIRSYNQKWPNPSTRMKQLDFKTSKIEVATPHGLFLSL